MTISLDEEWLGKFVEERIKENIRESIEEVFFSDDEFSPFNLLQDKIN